MKTVIYKYKLKERINEIELPFGAVVLSFQSQFNDPTMWVRLDPVMPTEKRVFYLINTGELFNAKNFIYLGTCQVDDGNFVFHLYESLYP